MASIRKRTTKTGTVRWDVMYRSPDGRQISETWATKADANQRAKELDLTLIRGDWQDPQRSAITVQVWAEHWLERQRVSVAPTTWEKARALVRHHMGALGPLRLDQITTDHVRAWMAAEAEKGDSAGEYLARLRMILKAAVEDGRLPLNPADAVKPPRRNRPAKRFLSAAELDLLVSAFPEQYRCLILVAGWSGLRWGEITGLHPRHVVASRGRITVAEQMARQQGGRLAISATKNHTALRTLTVPSSVAAVLDAHMKTLPTDAKLVFAGPKGAPLGSSRFRKRVWLPALELLATRDDGPRLDVRGMTFHGLRHTAASLAIAAGGQQRDVMAMLGHSTPAMTLSTYGHLFPDSADRLAEAMEKLRQSVG